MNETYLQKQARSAIAKEIAMRLSERISLEALEKVGVAQARFREAQFDLRDAINEAAAEVNLR